MLAPEHAGFPFPPATRSRGSVCPSFRKEHAQQYAVGRSLPPGSSEALPRRSPFGPVTPWRQLPACLQVPFETSIITTLHSITRTSTEPAEVPARTRVEKRWKKQVSSLQIAQGMEIDDLSPNFSIRQGVCRQIQSACSPVLATLHCSIASGSHSRNRPIGQKTS